MASDRTDVEGQEEISLAALEDSQNEILQRVAERLRQGDSASVSAGTHNSHGSSHHTSSSLR